MKIRTACSAAASLVLAAIATAQPTPNADLGTLANPSVTTGTLTGFVAAQVQWIKFTVPADATLAGAGYLDIDTNGGTLTGGDSHIGLYRADGTFLNSNDDSGPGLYSMLSYGRTTPNRPGLAQTGNATSVGSAHAGASGATTITAGTYYLAVTGFGGNVYGANFAATSTHARTGDVAYRIDYVGNPPSLPPFCSLALAPATGPTGTSFVATATITPGSGPASTGIAVSLNATTVNGGTVTLLDNGVAPDAVAGDNIFTGNVTVGAGAPFGAQTLTSTVSDAQARSSTCTATFTVIAPPPANDDCTGAFAISGTGTFSYDTNGATTSLPASTCGLIGTDVWFAWNSGPGGQTTFATCGQTTVDTAIAVYSDCSTSIACDDDGCGGVGASTLTFCAAPNTNYLLRVGDFAGGNPHVGAFVITSGSDADPTFTSALSPACGGPGTVVTMTAQITSNGCPAGENFMFMADASGIGDGNNIAMHDDGTGGDVTAGDGIYTGLATVGPSATSTNIFIGAWWTKRGEPRHIIIGGGNPFTVPAGATDEAGDTLATAADLSGQTLTSISGSLNSTPGCTLTADDVDMYKISICDPAGFSASTVAGTSYDTQLFLFDSNGMGVTFNDDDPSGTGGLRSFIGGVIVGTHAAGDFYLAIASYDQDPLDSTGQALWIDTPFGVERAPDGPGAANPLASWDTGGNNSGAYVIALTGVCPVAPACHGTCVADFDDGSGTGTPDGGVTIDDLLYYLGIFEQGVLCADVDDGSGTGTQDMGVTIDDLLYFLQRFEEGC